MRPASYLLLAIGLFPSLLAAQQNAPTFRKLRLTDVFYCEGAYFGDFNRDGRMDVVSGPYWYEGPDFQKKHEIYPPKPFKPEGYSDNFLTYTADFNGDGWTDVFYVPFPGQKGYWAENPAGKEGHWKKHLALESVGNESPMWADINGDGRPELLFNINGYFGFATWNPAEPDKPWTFHAITPKGGYGQFTHGMGMGDINGDGRNDMIESGCWWEQPANWNGKDPWIRHPFKFADAAAQMYIYDVDGDGLNDVITTLHCHQYGLVWWKQVRDEKGQITFQKNVIMGSKPEEHPLGWKHSQLHAIELVDINGDGLKDILTGKRFWAHGPKGDADPNAPAVVIWFELRRDKEKGVQWISHEIDNDSGVGTQVAACDLNGDGIPDVIVGNKKGTFIFLSEKK